MHMSHIYQPLLIRSLVESGGTATLRQLAVSFVQDESQLLYYEDRLKKMPLPVLKRHGIVDWHGKLVTLNVDELSYKEKARIKALCEQKIQEFLESKGLATWDYWLFEDDPVPDSMRYEVLRRGMGRCALCGGHQERSAAAGGSYRPALPGWSEHAGQPAGAVRRMQSGQEQPR